MGYRSVVSIDCTDLGRRVTVRYRTSDGMASDVVGILEHCDEASFGIRDRRSRLTYVTRADAVAGHVIPSQPWDEQDEDWKGGAART